MAIGQQSYSKITYILAFLLFVIAFWGLTYTSDWQGYDYLFRNQKSVDGLFNLLSSVLVSQGYEYRVLFRLHIIFIALNYTYLFKICRVNPLLYTLIILSLQYVEIGNQIRFFLAFPLSYIGFYYFNKRRLTISLPIFFLAVYSHYSCLLLIVSLIVFKYTYKKYIYFYIIVGGFLAYGLYNSGINLDERYDSYYETSATMLGGFYHIFPALFSICCIFYLHRRLIKYDNRLTTNQFYVFLLVSSLATSYLCITSLKVLILTSRFLNPLVIIWLAYLSYVIKRVQIIKIKKIGRYFQIGIISIFGVYRYFLPFILGNMEMIIKTMEMISSYEK